MGKDLGTLDEYLGSKYEAYAGPETGGFGVLPQSAVPDLGVDEETRRRLLGDATTPPSPFAGTNPKFMPPPAAAAPPTPPVGPPPVAAAPLPDEMPAVSKRGDLGTFNEYLGKQKAASTIAPKGGTPYQPSVLVDQAMEDFRRLMQPISRQERAVKEQVAADRSTLGNIAQSHMTEVGNAMLHTPSVVGDVLSYPVRRTIDYARGKGPQDTPVFGAVPRVGVEDVGAVLGSLGGDRTVEQARQNIDVNEAARREVYPTSSGIGDLTGTVQTLSTLRGPFTEKMREFEYKTTKQMNKGKTLYQMAPYADKAARSKVLLQSPGFNALLRGAGRTAEAGLEGTAIALLDEKDPATAAAFSAGTQGMVSMGTEALMRKFAKLPSRVATLAVNGGILTGALYGLQVLAPGEARDYEAQKAAAHKMILGYTLGAALSLVGARARSGAGSVDMPHLTDALASGPRNVMQKVGIDYLNADENGRKNIGEKLAFMQKNLGEFTDTQLRNLSSAFDSGNVDRFYSELDKIIGAVKK